MDGAALVPKAADASDDPAALDQDVSWSSPRSTVLAQVIRWLAAPFPPGKLNAAISGVRRPSRARASTVRLLIATQVVLGILIATTTVLIVMHLRDHALMEAGRELRSNSVLLADQAERALEGVGLVQAAILERYQDKDIRTPDDFRQHMSTSAVHEDLRNRVSVLPQLDAVAVIDADGNLVNFSRSSPVPKLNVADRNYFKALKGDPFLTTFFSEPVENRASGSWTIFLARKVSGPEHTFLGLVLAAIPLHYFEQLYREVAAGPDSAISMFRKDGVLLARYPHIDAQIGQSFGQNLAFTHQKATSTDSIVIRKISQVDGRERLIAAKSLVHYPVVVNVMDSVSAILTEWWEQTCYIIAAAIIMEIVLVTVGVLMLRQLRSQRMLNEVRAVNAEAEAELLVAHERERAGREMRIQNARFEAALNNMSQALCMYDADDHLVVANIRLAEMFGLPAGSIVPGMSIEAIGLTFELSNLPQVDQESMFFRLQRLKAARTRASEISDFADGRTLAINFVPVQDDGWLMTLEDITDHQVAKARIMHMAHHDALTGLPNRVLFHEKLTEAVARSRRGDICAVLYLDLDHFKAVNDTLGHPVGDALLWAVTQRLRLQVRETDTVARLGGDEFAIVQSSVEQPHDATILAQRLIEALCVPYELDGHQVIIGTSIGIAIVPTDGTDPDQILKNADMALYRAKLDGRSRYCFFEPAMHALMQARRALEIDLRKALVAGEFVLFYQPLMNIKTESLIGFEALMRWVHPDRGLVQPCDFIPLAEEIGLLVPLGEWALRRACFDAVTWPADMKVAVNVSVTQFASRTLAEDVARALRDSGLDPSRLELEITETVMLQDTEDVLRILHQLRNLGVGIALDDFGTGYSSLSYLRRFPFTKVKIDRSFIDGLGKRGDSDVIVTAVTDLCETLGMVALAEGVETEEQLRRLRLGNCGEAQGYLFSRPRPADEVTELCRTLNLPKVVMTI